MALLEGFGVVQNRNNPYDIGIHLFDKPHGTIPNHNDCMVELWTIISIRGPEIRQELVAHLEDVILACEGNGNCGVTIQLQRMILTNLDMLIRQGVRDGHFVKMWKSS